MPAASSKGVNTVAALSQLIRSAARVRRPVDWLRLPMGFYSFATFSTNKNRRMTDDYLLALHTGSSGRLRRRQRLSATISGTTAPRWRSSQHSTAAMRRKAHCHACVAVQAGRARHGRQQLLAGDHVQALHVVSHAAHHTPAGICSRVDGAEQPWVWAGQQQRGARL